MQTPLFFFPKLPVTSSQVERKWWMVQMVWMQVDESACPAISQLTHSLHMMCSGVGTTGAPGAGAPFIFWWKLNYRAVATDHVSPVSNGLLFLLLIACLVSPISAIAQWMSTQSLYAHSRGAGTEIWLGEAGTRDWKAADYPHKAFACEGQELGSTALWPTMCIGRWNVEICKMAASSAKESWVFQVFQQLSILPSEQLASQATSAKGVAWKIGERLESWHASEKHHPGSKVVTQRQPHSL